MVLPLRSSKSRSPEAALLKVFAMSRDIPLNPAGNTRAVSHELMRSPLIYLAAPFSHPNPEVSRHGLEEVNRYAVHLLSRGILAFSPLSLGT